MPSISVKINGKTYRMACDEGEESRLEALARKFDSYVDELKGSFGEIGDQRLTVMAGIMVTDELTELRSRVEEVEGELKSLKESRNLQSRERKAGDDDLARGIDKAASSIERLTTMLSSDPKA